MAEGIGYDGKEHGGVEGIVKAKIKTKRSEKEDDDIVERHRKDEIAGIDALG